MCRGNELALGGQADGPNGGIPPRVLRLFVRTS